jgi:hypothetical protein
MKESYRGAELDESSAVVMCRHALGGQKYQQRINNDTRNKNVSPLIGEIEDISAHK